MYSIRWFVSRQFFTLFLFYNFILFGDCRSFRYLIQTLKTQPKQNVKVSGNFSDTLSISSNLKWTKWTLVISDLENRDTDVSTYKIGW